MPDEDEGLCDLWEDAPPEAPPKSRLYHLEPVGIGTPRVESLTSYLSRLAEAHSVFPRALLAKEVAPVVQSHATVRQRVGRTTAFWGQSYQLNGLTGAAQQMVEALETLTARRDLRALTLRCWHDILSPTRLLRRVKAWCPACYEAWRITGQVIYDPLLWTLECITACPYHRVTLQTACSYPACGRTQPPLAPRAQPGYCAWCQRWLGAEPQCEPSEQADWEQWVGHAVGEVLASMVRLSTPPARARIALVLETVGGTNQMALARQLQVTQAAIWQWLHGQHNLQLGTLVHLSARLRLSPLQFLTAPLEALHEMPPAAPVGDVPPRELGDRRARQPFDLPKMREVLEAVLANAEEPPPTMQTVAQRLGYDQAPFRRHFPELCRAISRRYLEAQTHQREARIQQTCEEVRQAAYLLHGQGRYPSDMRIRKVISTRGAFKERAVREAWQATLKELGWSQVRKAAQRQEQTQP